MIIVFIIIMKKIIISILILFKELVLCYYPYTSRLQLQIKSNNKNPAISFMNLNQILNKNEKKNNLTINYYNNNSSILFNYNTYSYLEDYKYSYKYLLKDKNTYLIKYDFTVHNENYKYLMLIKSSYMSLTKIKWDIYMKYNNLIFNKQINDKIISKNIRGCILKNETIINPILKEFFK